MVPGFKLKLGTRASALALAQTKTVAEKIRMTDPSIDVEIIAISTEGDRDQQSPLSQIGGTGVFIKALENALLEKHIDAAVHSAKDLPSSLDERFQLSAAIENDPREDILISPKSLSVDELPPSTVIGSGSPRRASQILYHRHDLIFKDIRGNIETRLRKLDSGDFDAIILARAAFSRLNMNRDFRIIPENISLPAPGQGIICVETLKNNKEANELSNQINDHPTYLILIAERSMLKTLGVGCGLPVAGIARIENGKMSMRGRILNLQGTKLVEHQTEGAPEDAEETGRKLGTLLKPAAEELLG
ncbi:MAG: hydroxymethylbilane synthase [candidate division Zixibacteria bacterium]|nr:hydroxymethylbilane synthase [candidate division Zixibacteria bacterium]